MNVAVIILAVIAVGNLALAAHLHGQLADERVKHRGEVRRLKKAYRHCRDQWGKKSTELAKVKRQPQWATNSTEAQP